MRIVISIPRRPDSAGRPRKIPLALVALLTVPAAVFGVTTGYFVRLDMPDLTALADYAPAEMTRILDRHGSLTASFATEKRILLDYEEIPESFRRALVASEDSRFYDHAGIDPVGGLRALVSDLRTRAMTQGASTLTMQLAGNLFLDRSQRTVRRKLQEAFLAMEIERGFSKQEIIRMYCNQVHFGHGLYGLEAAARYYFGKTAPRLTTGESATLVGLLPRPADYSPYRDMERATHRRNLVLRRMVDEGYLKASEARPIIAEPIVLSPTNGAREPAAHFNENVRRWLQEEYGSGELYRGGMIATTTLDPAMQLDAEQAVEHGLRQLDKRQGWRGEVRRIPRDVDPAEWVSPAWSRGIAEGAITDAVVLQASATQAELQLDGRRGILSADDVRWTGESRPDRLFRSGDVVRVRVDGGDDDAPFDLSLEQEPQVEAALVAIDPATGEILALVGGFDFERSEYDRVTQARRQPGSLFKPLIYAAALAEGFTLSDVLLDEPTVFLDPRKPDPYQPENFSRKYYGTVTLRTALEKSINIATVKLLQQIGYDGVLDTARRLGIASPLRPYPSLALGAFEVTLLEATSAYGALANQGLLLEPHLIKEVHDRGGRTLYRSRAQVSEAVSPAIAYLMNHALTGVIRRGTGRTAGKVLEQTLAGKTGTTDDYTDAWFVGYSPELVVGVWVGFDDPRSLGDRETGARAALPIWTEFMRKVLGGRLDRPFPIPLGVTTATVDAHTGKRPHQWADCTDLVPEVFIEGSEPTETCTETDHRRLRLPYPFQRYELDASGALMIPRNELDGILDHESTVFWDRPNGALDAELNPGSVRLPLRLLPDTAPVPPVVLDDGTPADWAGTDGRPAQVHWLD